MKPFVDLYLVYDDKGYKTTFQDANLYLQRHLRGDDSLGIYLPITYASDFWVLRKQLNALNTTDLPQNLTTVTIRAGTLAKEYFGYQE